MPAALAMIELGASSPATTRSATTQPARCVVSDQNKNSAQSAAWPIGDLLMAAFACGFEETKGSGDPRRLIGFARGCRSTTQDRSRWMRGRGATDDDHIICGHLDGAA